MSVYDRPYRPLRLNRSPGPYRQTDQVFGRLPGTLLRLLDGDLHRTTVTVTGTRPSKGKYDSLRRDYTI